MTSFLFRKSRDLIQKSSTESALTFDADLIGLWLASSGTWTRIADDGWSYLTSAPYPYEIAADGSTLTFTKPQPDVVYQRQYGTGQNLIGSWILTEVDGPDTWVEELTYRADGTYTSHWTVNGTFDTEWFGNYLDLGSEMSSEERRALISTTAPDEIYFDVPYGPDFSGSYSKLNADNWELTVGGTKVGYTRLP